MTKEIKQCCVRMPECLHHWVKSHAYMNRMTLQEYIIYLLDKERALHVGGGDDGLDA